MKFLAITCLLSSIFSSSFSQTLQAEGRIGGLVRMKVNNVTELEFLKEQNKVQGQKIIELEKAIEDNKES